MSGDIYVAGSYNSRIQRFDATGVYKGSLTASYLSQVEGLAITPSGTILSTGFIEPIYEFSPALTRISSFGSVGPGFNEIGFFTKGIAVAPSGDIYIADSNGSRIQKLDSSGNYTQTIGSRGSEDGYFSAPYDVATDTSGNLYVADTLNSRVQVFDSSGSHKLSFGGGGSEGRFFFLAGVVVNEAGVIFTAELLGGHIRAFRPDGTQIISFGTRGNGAGQFREAYGITISNSNRIYVTDKELGRVQILQWNPVAPDAPTLTSAVPSDRQITLTFNAPDYNGGDNITGYTASCNGIKRTFASSPIIISSLRNGTEYACAIVATNSAGESTLSNTVYATPAEPPSTPQITNTDYGNEEIYLTVSVANNGGSTISSYNATCIDGTTPYRGTSSTSRITVSGLTNGVGYSCSVTATNAAGTSAPSASSPPIVPEYVPVGLPIWLLYEASK